MNSAVVLGALEGTPLSDLRELMCGRVAHDLVDEHIVTAVTRAREAGIPWGVIAEVLRSAEAETVVEPGSDAAELRFTA